MPTTTTPVVTKGATVSDEVRIRKRGSKRSTWCKHYNGTVNKTCKAGVEYASVRVEHEPVLYRIEGDPPSNPPQTQRVSLPCFRDENYGGAACAKCEFMTETEAAEHEDEAEFAKRCEGIGKARAAIVKHLLGPWKKRMPGSQGAIDCPVCSKPQALHFTRASCNGHIHAKCETPDCVSWME